MSRKKDGGAHVGAASLVLIFIVLCLTVFAVLTFVSAKAEKKLADKAAAAVSAYYVADGRGEDMLSSCRQYLTQGHDAASLSKWAQTAGYTVKEQNGRYYISHAETIDDRQELQIVLAASNNRLEVLRWQVTDKVIWQPDESLPVWQGD